MEITKEFCFRTPNEVLLNRLEFWSNAIILSYNIGKNSRDRGISYIKTILHISANTNFSTG